jgi:hypothetical protein
MKATRLLSTLKIGLFAFLCFVALIATQGVHAAVPLPTVTGPIPVTAQSYPFNAASHTTIPQDLTLFGYVEEEYFVSGLANVYDLNTAGTVIVRTAHAPYSTRILVRRPARLRKFSGTVIVELLNPTARFDLDIQWQLSRGYFLAHGDCWVGITSKPVAVKALKHFDPQRYAPLSWANPLPPALTCPDPYSPFQPTDTTPATENGLVWDIMSQVGALLKKSSLLPPNHPLHGFSVKRVFATGYSQTGGFLVTYINFIRPLATAHLDNGEPVYDGYLIGDGDARHTPLNQCAVLLPLDDPRWIIQPRSEPVISVVTQTTESIVSINRISRRPDSDWPGDRYRRYEVPGASHLSQRQIDLSPSLEDKARTGVAPAAQNCIETAQYGRSDFPLEYIMNGAFANLDAWVRDSRWGIVPPPRAPRIILDTISHLPVLDGYGNATGGVRTPYLDVPVATYYAQSHAADDMSTFMCELTGYKVPFDASLLRQLYPHDCFFGLRNCSYVRRVRNAVNALVSNRFITADDGDRIKSEARRAGAQLP